MARPTKDDLKWAEEYRKTFGKYDRPSVTADIVALRPAYDEDINWRENPVFALEMLFIKRSGSPLYPGSCERRHERVVFLHRV